MNFKPYASNILHTTWMLRTSQKIWTLEVDVRPSATRETASSVPFGDWIRPVPHCCARSSKSNSSYLTCVTERVLQKIKWRFLRILRNVRRTVLPTVKFSNHWVSRASQSYITKQIYKTGGKKTPVEVKIRREFNTTKFGGLVLGCCAIGYFLNLNITSFVNNPIGFLLTLTTLTSRTSESAFPKNILKKRQKHLLNCYWKVCQF